MMPLWDWMDKHHNIAFNLATSNPPPLTREDYQVLGIEIPGLNLGEVYPYGLPELREVLSSLYGVGEENVFIGSGCSDTNDTIFDAFIQRGDNILVEIPTYQPLLKSSERRAQFRGAEVRRFYRKPQDEFKIDIDEVVKLVDRNTRLVVLTNLNNPTGVKTSEEGLIELTELTRDANLIIMVDEVYRRHCPELPSAYPLNNRALITDSLSKYFGATELRIGWAIGDKKVVEQLRSVQGYRNVVNNPRSEKEATDILKQDPKYYERRVRTHLNANYGLFQEWLSRRDDASLVEPDGHICCFPRLHKVADTLSFVNNHLSPRYSTLVVPGEFYGLSGYVRIGFGIPAQILEQGLGNLGRALDDYKE